MKAAIRASCRCIGNGCSSGLEIINHISIRISVYLYGLHSSARIVWNASITVTEASAINIMKKVSDNDVAAPAPARTMRAGLKLLNQALSAFHFHVSSAAQLPATTTYAAIWTRVTGRDA